MAKTKHRLGNGCQCQKCKNRQAYQNQRNAAKRLMVKQKQSPETAHPILEIDGLPNKQRLARYLTAAGILLIGLAILGSATASAAEAPGASITLKQLENNNIEATIVSPNYSPATVSWAISRTDSRCNPQYRSEVITPLLNRIRIEGHAAGIEYSSADFADRKYYQGKKDDNWLTLWKANKNHQFKFVYQGGKYPEPGSPLRGRHFCLSVSFWDNNQEFKNFKPLTLEGDLYVEPPEPPKPPPEPPKPPEPPEPPIVEPKPPEPPKPPPEPPKPDPTPPPEPERPDPAPPLPPEPEQPDPTPILPPDPDLSEPELPDPETVGQDSGGPVIEPGPPASKPNNRITWGQVGIAAAVIAVISSTIILTLSRIRAAKKHRG